MSIIKEGINYVHDLFKDKNCELIFLADRWFPAYEILEHINSIGDTYCIRAKSRTSIYIYNNDKL